MPQRHVIDATVWIDLYVRPDLVPVIFRARLELYALDLVCDLELGTRNVKQHDGRSLTVASLNGEEMREATELHRHTPSCSIRDTAQVVLAHRLGATLLTGDASLRKLAKEQSVEIHGTLWLLRRIDELKLLPPDDLASWLKAMCAGGSRFPKEDAEALLLKWQASAS